MATRVFVSYRREDTSWVAGRLCDYLSSHLGSGQVFMDVDMSPGVDWKDEIASAISTCDVLLALIGPRWLDATDSRGRRRLDDPSDMAVSEIAAALEQNVRVVPVRVDNALLPTEEQLPERIRRLARRQAVELGHTTFNSDAANILHAIQTAHEPPGPEAAPAGSTEPAPEPIEGATGERRRLGRRAGPWAIVSACVILAGAAILGYVLAGGSSSSGSISIHRAVGVWDNLIYPSSPWHAKIDWSTKGASSCTFSDDLGDVGQVVSTKASPYGYGRFSDKRGSALIHLRCAGATAIATATRPSLPTVHVHFIRAVPGWLPGHTHWQMLITWNSQNAIDCNISNSREQAPVHRDPAGETGDPYGAFSADASSVTVSLVCTSHADTTGRADVVVDRPS
jgi:hypothetical protein